MMSDLEWFLRRLEIIMKNDEDLKRTKEFVAIVKADLGIEEK